MINRRKLTPEDFRLMNIGEAYWAVSFNNIPNNLDYYRYVIKYLSCLDMLIKNGWGVLFWGPNSTGKTALAIIIGKEARRRGYTVFFISAIDYVYSRNQLFSEDETIESRCKNVDVLIIDDIVQEGIDKIEELIRYRDSRKKVVILTMNVAESELEKKLGKSLFEVLQAMVFPIKVEGINWREIESQEIEKSFEVR